MKAELELRWGWTKPQITGAPMLTFNTNQRSRQISEGH